MSLIVARHTQPSAVTSTSTSTCIPARTVSVTVPLLSTGIVDTVSTSEVFSVVWYLNLQTSTKSATLMVHAVHQNGTNPSHTYSGMVGTLTDYDMDVVINGTSLSLVVDNTGVSDITVTATSLILPKQQQSLPTSYIEITNSNSTLRPTSTSTIDLLPSYAHGCMWIAMVSNQTHTSVTCVIADVATSSATAFAGFGDTPPYDIQVSFVPDIGCELSFINNSSTFYKVDVVRIPITTISNVVECGITGTPPTLGDSVVAASNTPTPILVASTMRNVGAILILAAEDAIGVESVLGIATPSRVLLWNMIGQSIVNDATISLNQVRVTTSSDAVLKYLHIPIVS